MPLLILCILCLCVLQGERGDKGDAGRVGNDGLRGEKGERGAAGIPGSPGEPGKMLAVSKLFCLLFTPVFLMKPYTYLSFSLQHLTSSNIHSSHLIK